MLKHFILLTALFLSACVMAEEERVVFNNSVLDEPPPELKTGTDTDSDLVVGFVVSFKLRNLDDLRVKVASGEKVSPKDLKDNYLPLEKDIEAAKKYFSSIDGLKVSPPTLTGFQVSGKVSVIEKILKVKFKDVKSDGSTFHWVANAPSLPKMEWTKAVQGLLGMQDRPFNKGN